jgi:hypothetical protein
MDESGVKIGRILGENGWIWGENGRILGGNGWLWGANEMNMWWKLDEHVVKMEEPVIENAMNLRGNKMNLLWK